jgi:two-component system phosphate regulon sensor histidine kinase PhoR
MPDACFIVDINGVLRYRNSVADRQFGTMQSGEPLTFSLRVPVLLEALERVRRGGAPETIRWNEKGPIDRWYEAHLAGMRPDRDAAQGPLPRGGFVLVVVHDLTEQLSLERMRADFVANASHELRTPLASLTGFIETLQGPARDDPEARERFLGIMHEQSERMARLIGDLLSLSRVEMRAHVHPETVVDLNDILRHVIDAMKPLADELSVEIRSDIPAEVHPVHGERDELVQVFQNLVENGLKYGGSGEYVDIAVKTEVGTGGSANYLVSIRDYGPGIASEHLPRLTERFYRVDVETSRQKQGTGLGLAIVKHILTRHRARLSIESAPGEGATFMVRIPAANDRERISR